MTDYVFGVPFWFWSGLANLAILVFLVLELIKSYKIEKRLKYRISKIEERLSRGPRMFLHPGWIKSKNDGQMHNITAPKLAKLYGVNIHKCIVVKHSDEKMGIDDRNGDTHLYPRDDGEYRRATK
jgi:hypothetical protein